MFVFQQNESTAARRRIYFRLVATVDDSPMTGASVTSAIRKNGATISAGGSVSELAGGLYYYECSAGDLDTLGSLIYTPTATGAYAFSYEAMVVEYNPFGAGPDAGSVSAAVWAAEVRALTDKADFAIGAVSIASIVEGLLIGTDGVEENLTVRDALRLIAAVVVGLSSGVADGTPSFRAVIPGGGGVLESDAPVRLQAIASEGDRSSITVTPS